MRSFLLLTLAISLLLFPLSARADTPPDFLLEFGSFGFGDGQFNQPSTVAVDNNGWVYAPDYLSNRIHVFDDEGNFLFKFGTAGSGPGQFNRPIDIAPDGLGNLYVVDTSNDRIQKLDRDGTFILEWGVAGSGDGEFSEEIAVVVDRDGNVLVLEAGNARVQKFAPDGTFISKFGSFGSGDGQFDNPRGLATDKDGNIFVSDSDLDRVQKFDSSGTFLLKWGSVGTGDGQFTRARDIVADLEGNVYVADELNARVQKFDTNGAFLTKWGMNGSAPGYFDSPWGLDVDCRGDVYVVDILNVRIQKFGAPREGIPQEFLVVGQTGIQTGDFDQPRDVVVDADGDIFVSDGNNDRIQKFDRFGNFITSWGSSGSGPGQFDAPSGLAITATGDIWVADLFNHRIQRFNQNGAFLQSVGVQGPAAGQLDGPFGIAIDRLGRIYVTEIFNDRVTVFHASGGLFVTFGNPGSGNGQFNGPSGITIDESDHVYVVDGGNDRIQKFRPSLAYDSQFGSSGTGPGEFVDPLDISLDADGNIYVTDLGTLYVTKFTNAGEFILRWNNEGSASGIFQNLFGLDVTSEGIVYTTDFDADRFQVFAAPAEILAIEDVGNDQGRQVSVQFGRAALDVAGSQASILSYSVFRRNDPLPAPGALDGEPQDGRIQIAAPAGMPPGQWTFVSSVPAFGEDDYFVVVPTLADSTADAGLATSAFFVRAGTATPTTFLDSSPDCGYSVDDLSPNVPQDLQILNVSYQGDVSLEWSASSDEDFQYFTLYRGIYPGFIPSEANRVTSLIETSYIDPDAFSGQATLYYKLTATDFSGNEGNAALASASVTAVGEGPVVSRFALHSAMPNPMRARSRIRFDLPVPTTATLQVFDMRGRLVRSALRDENLPAGRHEWVWDGRGDGGNRVAAGIYLYRLETDAFSANRRIVIIE